MTGRNLKKFLYAVYPLAVLIYLAELISDAVRPGICLTAVLLLAGACIFLSGSFTLKTTEDRIFAGYLVYNILSGIWCLYYGIPVSVYIGEVSTTALPMVFYYAGRDCREEETGRLYLSYALAALLMGLIGVVLYIWAPRFYLDFSYEKLFISVADAPTSRVRMNSLVGSGALAAFTTYAVCVSAFFIRSGEGKKKAAGLFLIVPSVIFTFMANQRSAMFCVILTVIFFFFADYVFDRTASKKPLFIGSGCIAAAVAAVFFFARGVFEKFYARLISIPQGFSERSESWVAAVNDMKNIWLGGGLGSRGHRAALYQQYIVADGGLVKLYTEMGIIGTSLIIFLIFLVYKKAFRDIGALVPEIAVITCAILMSIGSNVLEIELCAPIVYFCLGRAVRVICEKSRSGS